MKSFLAVAALAALIAPAFAGDSMGDYACENACPLAEMANYHRAYGDEAQTTSLVVRAELADEVEANLARI